MELAHCGESFRRCATLEYHVEQGACQHFNPCKPEAFQPHIARRNLRARFSQQGLEAMCADQELCQEPVSACAMCGRHISHAFRMSKHIMRCHQQVYQRLLSTRIFGIRAGHLSSLGSIEEPVQGMVSPPQTWIVHDMAACSGPAQDRPGRHWSAGPLIGSLSRIGYMSYSPVVGYLAPLAASGSLSAHMNAS